jgi:hypothetical protein
MIVGIISAAGNGALLPLFAILTGELMDTLNITDSDKLYDEMSELATYFVYAGIAIWVFAGGKFIYNYLFITLFDKFNNHFGSSLQRDK